MDIYGSKRLEGEDFDSYKKRVRNEKLFFKLRLKGVTAWNNKTYVKELHGDIQVSISK